jgi:hypothetical protein
MVPLKVPPLVIVPRSSIPLPPELRIRSVKPSAKLTVPPTGNSAPDVTLRHVLVVAAVPSLCTDRLTGIRDPSASAPPVHARVVVFVRVRFQVPDA